MKFLNRLFGKKDSPSPSVTSGFVASDPEKAQRAVALVEKYIKMNHPVDPVLANLMPTTKPEYTVQSGGIVRRSNPGIDLKIVSVVTCLPSKNVNMTDHAQLAQLANDAVYHYASLSKVQALFSLPYHLRVKTYVEGAPFPPEEQCRILSGVENLLLEIYEELPQGGTITDDVVNRKIDRLIESVQVARHQSPPQPSPLPRQSPPLAPPPAQEAGESKTAPTPVPPPPVSPPSQSPLPVEETKGPAPASVPVPSSPPVVPAVSTTQEQKGSSIQRCPSCAQNVLPVAINDRQYCPECGVPLSASTQSQPAVARTVPGQSLNCPSCTNVVSPVSIAEILYCPECGVRLS